MDQPFQPNETPQPASRSSKENLQLFFLASLRELYFANEVIGVAFDSIQEKIGSPQLEEVLNTHYGIHLNHKNRLEKIFILQNMPAETKDCLAVNALLSQGMEYLALFTGDVRNWEIALLLTSRKLAHYKIAAYGAAAHLALSLQHASSATLLAVSVQEEEEFIERYLNGLTHDFLTPLKDF